MTSVSEQDSGVVAAHVRAIEEVTMHENAFLFLRPTELDSTRLIKEGYATKSMDIHDKSSNWGPMSGFVPCDPAFSKKLVGTPNAALHVAAYKQAQPVQLFLTSTLVNGLSPSKIKVAANANEYKVHAEKVHGDTAWIVERVPSYMRSTEQSTRRQAVPPRHVLYVVADPIPTGTKSTMFCLESKGDKSLVYWVNWSTSLQNKGRLIPLKVWAYAGPGGLLPVTGDYDIWMVAPHLRQWRVHAPVEVVGNSHGNSAASPYTTGLLQTLNVKCGRRSNPVFNHGAEAQNVGFTQALDTRLVMFTPAGTSRMIELADYPAVMNDVQRAGYLVFLNRQYSALDPRLNGQRARDPLSTSDPKDIMTLVDSFIRRVRLKAALDQKYVSNAAGQLNRARNHWAIAYNGVKLGVELAKIVRFEHVLRILLAKDTNEAPILEVADFPPSYRAISAEIQRLHSSLQQEVANATTDDGSNGLQTWIDHNAESLLKLQKKLW